MRRALHAAAALLLIAVPAACEKPAPESASAFDGYVRDVAVTMADDDPEWAHAVGLASSDGDPYRLTDRSANALVRRRAIALRRDAQLRAFDPNGLEADAAFSRAALSARFAALATGARAPFGRYDALLGFSPYVLATPDAAFEALPAHFASLTRFQTLRDGYRYVEALDDAADAIDAETDRARDDFAQGIAPPDFVIDETLARLDRFAAIPPDQSPYVVGLREGLIALVGALPGTAPATIKGAPAVATATPPSRDQMRARALLTRAEAIVANRIQSAYARAAASLRVARPAASAEPGIGRLPDGAALYAAALRTQTGVDFDAETLRARALRRIEALERDLDGPLRVLGKTEGDPVARLAQLAADPLFRYPPTEDGGLALLADARDHVELALEAAPAWFAKLPKAELTVTAMPPRRRGGASALYEPPKLGGGPAHYWLDTSDPASISKLDLPTQNRRLAVPGLHVQKALARENAALPTLRRVLSVPGFSEGWGAYAEQLVEETGGYDAEPLARVGALRRRLWDAARVVVDIDMHTRAASRDALADYLRRKTGFSDAEINATLLRAATEPGAIAAAEVGRTEFERLRERAQSGLGAEFDLRRFHDVVLRGGEMPFSALERAIDDEIAALK